MIAAILLAGTNGARQGEIRPDGRGARPSRSGGSR
jgi:hypothetical protein